MNINGTIYKFIKEKYQNTDTQRTVEHTFKKIATWEEKFNKSLFNFSKDELWH
jgi:hypothetical protein